MDRNTLIGILLIAIILIGYALLNKPSKERLEEAQRVRDSLENIQRMETDSLAQPVTTQQEQLQDEEMVESEAEEAVEIPANLDQYGDFAGAAVGQKEMIVIENDMIILTLSTKGGRPWARCRRSSSPG